jgi:hypothetical protein
MQDRICEKCGGTRGVAAVWGSGGVPGGTLLCERCDLEVARATDRSVRARACESSGSSQETKRTKNQERTGDVGSGALLGSTTSSLGWDTQKDQQPPRKMTSGAVKQLWADHAAGVLHPVPVELGPLPQGATADHRRVARDIALLIGLARAAGYSAPVPYTYRFCAWQRMDWPGEAGRQRAGEVLRDLRRAGTFSCPGALEARPGMPGSALWAEALPAEQEVVAAGPAVPVVVEADGDVGGGVEGVDPGGELDGVVEAVARHGGAVLQRGGREPAAGDAAGRGGGGSLGHGGHHNAPSG